MSGLRKRLFHEQEFGGEGGKGRNRRSDPELEVLPCIRNFQRQDFSGSRVLPDIKQGKEKNEKFSGNALNPAGKGERVRESREIASSAQGCKTCFL